MIEILKNKEDFYKIHADKTQTIGFVPTMGNLHKGHLSLIETSILENSTTIVSIYVNPKQFSQDEDFTKYPRTLKLDLEKVTQVASKYREKHVYVFIPESNEVIYPENFQDYVSVHSFNKIIEGELRPSHFDGVATVVKRLFKIVAPHNAYFGKKDYQQLCLITELVKQEDLHINIIGLPIIREEDGLAMSSRNSYLDQTQRKEALALINKLNEVATKLVNNGLVDANFLCQRIKEEDPRFNYLEIRKQKSLQKPHTTDRELVLLGNLQVGTTRILDNIEVNI